ncbi:MAG: FliH/SctL family protein [Ignavibacteria bacterium]|jgi:flagellar assembly protein FliH
MSDVIKLSVGSKKKNIKAIVPENGVDFSNFQAFDEEALRKKELETKFNKAFQDGYEKAKCDLEEEYSNQFMQKTEEFYSILSSFEQKLISYEDAFEKIIVEVSSKIAEKILQREIENKTIVGTALSNSAKKVLGANEIIIKINPEDLKLISTDGTVDSLEKSFSRIKFEEDKSIDKGGCFIETEIGNVDARIETQLEEIKRKLEQSLVKEEK